MIAPVFIVTLALMLALVSAAAPLAADVKVQSTKKAIPKGLQMMQERMFGAASKKVPNPIMRHMLAVHGKDQAAVSSATASAKSLPALEADTVNKKSAAKKDFKAQWTVGTDDFTAETGDVLHYDFYPSDNHCHEDDLIGRMSYKFGACINLPDATSSFVINGMKKNINDNTPNAGPYYSISSEYYDQIGCTGNVRTHVMRTGAAVDECKAFGYYQPDPDDINGGAIADDMFGGINVVPSKDRLANKERHFFDNSASAFQVSTDETIVDEIEDSYTLYSLATAGACTGSNNNEKVCKDALEQAVMAQTWGNVKFDDCRYAYTVDDEDYKNNGAPIYSAIVCDEERGPVYYEYHDAQCRKIYKHPDGSYAKGVSKNSDYGGFKLYTFDDYQSEDQIDVNFNAILTCKAAKKSFYPIMVALVVGFVVVLPVTAFAFYMLNKRFGWSLGTAFKRAFNIADAEQSSDEGKSVELAPVNTA